MSNVFYCIFMMRSCDGIWAHIFSTFLSFQIYCTATLDLSFYLYLESTLLETELIYLSVPRSSQNPLTLMYLQSKPESGENTETRSLLFKNGPLRNILSCWRCKGDAFWLSLEFYHKVHLRCGLLSPLYRRFERNTAWNRWKWVSS